ncbi:MAG: tetratricopeptide repeat protein [Syntrophorhabdales bacterium]|jgi:tetratricopeptide (TPR) repeat protein
MCGIKKASIGGMVLFASLVLSCASNTGFVNYREGLFQGCRSLQDGDYQPALQEFLRATQADPTRAWPLAMAGQAAYQMGDYAQASQYLAQAEDLVKGQNHAYLVVKAYQTLIAFKENRQQEGMTALAEYVRVYGFRFSHPDITYQDVEHMYQSGRIRLLTLEELINYQISRYETYFPPYLLL